MKPVDDRNNPGAILGPALRLDVQAGIATLTLNRPEKRNAVTLDLWRKIGRTVTTLGEHSDVRVIVITGTGGSFCAGADISEFGEVRSNERQVIEYEAEFDGCCNAIEAVAKPVIAAIDGFCIGGGCNLAMACDFRFATPTAKFGIPAARLSIVYGIAGTRRLFALVGLSQAKRILYSGRQFGSAEALRIGFVDEICEDALEAAATFAAVLKDNAPLSISGAKTILSGLASGKGALREEDVRAAIERAARSYDYAEGRAAFAEKRLPRFRGD